MRYLLVLLLVSIAALAYGQSSRQTPQSQTGRFLVVVSAEGGTAWRLDTANGGLMYCVTAMRAMNPLADQKGRDASCTEMMK